MKRLGIAVLALASTLAGLPAQANKHVDANLTAADGLWSAGKNGCPSVKIAIEAAENPDIYGAVESYQIQTVAW